MNTKKSLFALFCYVLLATTPAFAEVFPSGATIVPVNDGLASQNFNLKTDAASIYLEKAILYKDNGWFTKDKEVAITAKMNINSRKKNSASTSLTISRVYKFDVSIYEDGRIEIPLKSLPLLDTFNLSGDDYIITSIVMDLYLSKKKEKSDFTKTLETVIAVSKKIPIPVNPYAEYASIFGDTFSEVVEKAISEGADTVPFASFGLRFLQGDKAASLTEKPGVHAVVIGSASKGDGVIAIEQLEGKSLSYNDIEGLKYGGKRVKNNHIVVRVTASTDPWKSMLAVNETVERITKEGKSALTISKVKGVAAPNLEAIINSGTRVDVGVRLAVEPQKLEKAISELNTIRSINTLKQ